MAATDPVILFDMCDLEIGRMTLKKYLPPPPPLFFKAICGTLYNKTQWNLNRNLYIFIQENAFENIVWKMAAFCVGLNLLILCYVLVHCCVYHFVTIIRVITFDYACSGLWL